MQSDYKKVKLNKLVLFQTGKLNSNAATPNGQYPFFTCSSQTMKTDTYSFDKECILLAGNNANGIYSLKYFNGKFDAYQRTYVITTLDNNTLLNRYLFYALQLKLELLKTMSTGVATKFLTLTILNDIDISLPLLSTQRKIATILSAYDDMIENNQRRIKNLEEMAQNIYREWFVKFRFPGHEKVKMVDSELGMIPERWKIKNATEAISVNPVTPTVKETEKPYVAMEGLSNNSMLISITEYRFGSSGAKFKNQDTLFARITPCLENGKTGFVQFLPSGEDTAFGSTEFIVLRSRTLCPEYVYLMARTESFRENAIKSMSGASGRQRVQYECFKKYLFAHPDRETLSKFSALTSPMFRYIYLLSKKNECLRRSRDLLLPKLISGEIDVSDLEIRIEEAA
jgi:type I restriction enzyme S subunit